MNEQALPKTEDLQRLEISRWRRLAVITAALLVLSVAAVAFLAFRLSRATPKQDSAATAERLPRAELTFQQVVHHLDVWTGIEQLRSSVSDAESALLKTLLTGDNNEWRLRRQMSVTQIEDITLRLQGKTEEAAQRELLKAVSAKWARWLTLADDVTQQHAAGKSAEERKTLFQLIDVGNELRRAIGALDLDAKNRLKERVLELESELRS